MDIELTPENLTIEEKHKGGGHRVANNLVVKMTIFYTSLGSNYAFRLPRKGLRCPLMLCSYVDNIKDDEKNFAASRYYGKLGGGCWPKPWVDHPPPFMFFLL